MSDISKINPATLGDLASSVPEIANAVADPSKINPSTVGTVANSVPQVADALGAPSPIDPATVGAVANTVPQVANAVADPSQINPAAVGAVASSVPQVASAVPQVASAVASGVPEVASALGTIAREVADRLSGGGDPLPKVNYTVTVEDGPDAQWYVRSMHFVEALSEPYLLTLELVTDEVTADTEQLLGANIELAIDRETITRTVCGVIHLVEYVGVLDDRLHVRIEVVPALFLLTQRIDTRLWQDATVIDIVKEVIEGAFADYERVLDVENLTATYNPREYVVQYHESDFDFVNRLLEAEGITYWFDHDRGTGKEVMVLEDSNDNYLDITTIDENPELHIIVDNAERAEIESLQFLDYTRELTSTAVYRRLFDWMTPIEPIEATAPAEGESDVDDRGMRREVYHHGRFLEDDPDPRTIRKLVHRTQRDKLVRGNGNVTGIFPGRKFALIDHQRADLDQQYLVRRVIHTGDCPDVVMGDPGSGDRYANRFECLVFDDQKPLRPPQITPRPRIYGPQTAIVTGPEGDEIHTDEHGRVKVRFDWDRVHELTEDTSMWIRVAHHWAGPGFGTFFVPRIGMEVVVEFIEGNPDRPLIIGCVYNGDNAISVGVPENKTKSTIRTRSSPNSDGYNELRFEDAAGSEEIFVHAQKDYNEVVENCHSTSVGADQANSVSGNQTQSVKKDQTETVDGHQKMTVKKTRTTEITENETNTYHASRSTTVEVNELLEVIGTTTIRSGDTITVEAQKDFKQTVAGMASVSVAAGKGGAGDASTKCDNNYSVEAKTKIHLSQNAVATVTLAGGNADHVTDGVFNVVAKGNLLLASTSGLVAAQASTKVEFSQGGGSITIEGGKIAIGSPSEITLSVGSNSVKIDAAGVSIGGAKVDIAASGITSISGAMVKIN